MSRSDLTDAVNALYDVVEVNNMGAVPAQVAAETLKLINPALPAEHATIIVTEADSRGKQLLLRADFIKAVEMTLATTEIGDAIRVVKDLIVRMRVSLRRRYLMYDAAPNTPPPSLLENGRAIAVFREIFDTVANGSDAIDRAQLRAIVNSVLPEFKADASNVCKAALGDPERDLVGFYEFMMVLQPATSKRALTDMLRMAKERASGSAAGGAAGGRAVGSRPMTTNAAAATATAAGSGQQGGTPMRGASVATLQQEVERLRFMNENAERRFSEIVASPQTLMRMPTAYNNSTSPPKSSQMKLFEREGSIEREVARLRLEKDDLQHKLTLAMHNQQPATAPISAHHNHSRSTASAAARDDTDESFVEALQAKVELLESELRTTRAQLAVSQEGMQLMSLLKQSGDAHAVLRDFYPDENPLVAKLDHLREISAVFHNDPGAPVATVLTQYDLLVSSYQALYRKWRERYDTARRKSFDQMEAAASIVPRTTVLSPSRAGMSSMTPSRSVSGRHSPARRIAASPIRWAELDREPTDEMRGTRTLADPLLTDEERNTLRAKLAAQMRGSARHYRPSSSPVRRGTSVASSVVKPLAGSHETMTRLSTIAGKAAREQRL